MTDKYRVRYSKVAWIVKPEIIEEVMTTEELITMLQNGGAVIWSAKLVYETDKTMTDD